MMPLVCHNTTKLKQEITSKYRVQERSLQTGTAFTFMDPVHNGLIVNIYNTGTVQFQGGVCVELQQQIQNLVCFINS